MVDLSSENSLALDNVAPSTHALGLDAARGAVRRRWLKKEKVVCVGHNKPGALFVTFAVLFFYCSLYCCVHLDVLL